MTKIFSQMMARFMVIFIPWDRLDKKSPEKQTQCKRTTSTGSSFFHPLFFTQPTRVKSNPTYIRGYPTESDSSIASHKEPPMESTVIWCPKKHHTVGASSASFGGLLYVSRKLVKKKKICSKVILLTVG